uniref:C-type lectin domain-containing protein n=1 Tax=Neogobius melanostomus TaxID=47308 RepID=A0A8C6UIQ0_9GOBI
ILKEDPQTPLLKSLIKMAYCKIQACLAPAMSWTYLQTCLLCMTRSVHVFKGSSGGQKQYSYISTSKSWEDARYHCRQHHTDLAMIEDESENNAVASVVVPNQWMWIGLYRQAWRWSDGSDSQFKNWGSGQPDNYAGDQHCAVEHYHKWDDASCSSKLKFYFLLYF